MNFTLNQLKIFLKIVETKSVTKASEDLNLTQPAVSIQLKNFQEQFDIPLTEVVGRKIFITDFGNEISLMAQKIINEVNSINNKTLAFKGQLTGRLKISVVSTGKYIIPYFLSDFINSNPGVELSIDVTNKSQVIKSLEKNEVDFSLVSILPTKLNIEKIDLLQNKLFLIGKNNIKKYPHFSKNLFNDIPLIYREQGSGTRQLMERYLEKNNITISKKMELSTNEAVKQSVVAGLGYSIMPLIGLKNELENKELHIIPVKGLPIKTTWSLIWMKGKNHSPVANSLLDYIKKEKLNIIANKFDWYEKY
jgi:DNA-binding transcriptional LysR family regulator